MLQPSALSSSDAHSLRCSDGRTAFQMAIDCNEPDGSKYALKRDQSRSILCHSIAKPMSAKCSFKGCTRWVFEKGLCRDHVRVSQDTDAAAAAAPHPPPQPPSAPPSPSPLLSFSSSSQVSVLQNPPAEKAAVARCVAHATAAPLCMSWHPARCSLLSSDKPPMPSL